MSIFDQLENAQAQAQQQQEIESVVNILRSWLEVKRRFARIVAINAVWFGVPLLFGVHSFAGLAFCIAILIFLNNVAPTPSSVSDPAAVGWQIKIYNWTGRWWVGALVAWFFGISAWGRLLSGEFHDHSQHLAVYQGIAVFLLSTLAWLVLQYGPRTNGMISTLRDLGVNYVRPIW
jgi:multisubunit Na+/H+ antiporter MnhB subunit